LRWICIHCHWPIYIRSLLLLHSQCAPQKFIVSAGSLHYTSGAQMEDYSSYFKKHSEQSIQYLWNHTGSSAGAIVRLFPSSKLPITHKLFKRRRYRIKRPSKKILWSLHYFLILALSLVLIHTRPIDELRYQKKTWLSSRKKPCSASKMFCV
jgi:hypothetical protein